ncbi:hypothetical protein [Epilithonimonas xixisoli]|uniref:Beta-carotene 15,15'-monooxygenase n=1 Tax=Epilithonimonas xixisoli TaxID=1476462 RepID=A0A4R8IGD8_9FLAO|nr:hypothetical protein [Epilithonimonas xixisoli]TDX84544.1 hypothetical protein B0I22_2167 [Epilithonimonas xixisoli]
MENFNEFENTGTVPDRDTGNIISHAFEIYKGIFMYPLVAGILYFIALSVIASITGLGALFMEMGQNSQSMGSYDPEMYNDIYRSTPFLTFMGGFSIINILLFSPLIVGTIYIAHKKNLNQKIDFSDLFIGYRQNFLHIVLYGLIFSIASIICTNLCYVPAIFVMPFLFLGYPFLLFQNVSAIEALKNSFEIVKNNYGNFLLLNLLAFLCSYLGLIGCCIGIILTYMFYYSTMYSAYCAYVALPRQLD